MSLSPYSPYKTSQRAPCCFIGFSRRGRGFYGASPHLPWLGEDFSWVLAKWLQSNGKRTGYNGGAKCFVDYPNTKTQPALIPLFVGQDRSYRLRLWASDPKISYPKPSLILTGDAEAEDVLVILKQFLYQGAFSCTRRAAQNHRPWSLHGWKDRKKKTTELLRKTQDKTQGTCGLPPTHSL